MTSIAMPYREARSGYRILGWGASAVLHGGALAFLLYGMPHPAPRVAVPEIIPLEMAAAPEAPPMDSAEPNPAMEEAHMVAPQATTVAPAPPPPLAMTPPDTATLAEPPPPVEALQPVEAAVVPPPTEMVRAPEPDVVPLEVAELPPPPPAPPPLPVQAQAPTPPQPRPPRREHARPRPEATTMAEVQPLASPAPPGPASAAPPRAAPSAAPSQVVAAPPANYIGQLSAALNRAKRYPHRARMRRAEGTALLNFSMRRDGTVVGWRLVRSSGDNDLDQAVGEMIQRASPLPPLPADIAGEIWSPTVPVAFNLN